MQKGLIISNVSNLYEVKVGEKIIQCKPKGKMKHNETTPVVGDIVEIELIENEQNKGIICDIEDRKMYSKRPKMANLTQIIFVLSLKSPKPDLLLLDKQLVYAEYLKIKPIICVNKVDIGKIEVLEQIHKIYEKIGYTVIDTVAKENIGIEKIKELLKGNITAFSGNSGVGKSTLINSIFGGNKTQEGNISEKNQKGKNTTTAITLYEINEGYIADTPGFSTFSVEEVESKELSNYFREFKKYLNDCKYLDCSHIKEDDCGIKIALEEGNISNERYENYVKIYKELKDKEEHKW